MNNPSLSSPSRAGFTLVELAIVIVIIGLIVGSILVGQDLINAARGRSILKEAGQFQSAAATFKSKFNEVPGDMANPARFFSTDADGNAVVWPAVAGNADSLIVWNSANLREGVLGWKQLEIAALIAASDIDISCADTGPCRAILGETIPASTSIKNAGWTLMLNTDTFKNSLLFGAPCGGLNCKPVLTPGDTFAIDSKVDDGEPNTGVLRAKGSNTCADPGDPNQYNVSLQEIRCNFDINLGI